MVAVMIFEDDPNKELKDMINELQRQQSITRSLLLVSIGLCALGIIIVCGS